MASENVREFTDASFAADVLGSKIPVVVDFWAPWCGPCKMLGPIIEDVAKDYEGKVVFGKVNVDENPQIASRYGIISIPTMLFVKNGSVNDQHVGLLAKAPLKNKIDQFIA